MALRTIGRYQVKNELDRGGMSVVYLAHDPRVDRDVAIKMLPHEVRDQPNVRRRFEREARTVAALEHAAIVPIYDFGEEDRRPYLVMRYMHGGSLAERLNTRMSLAGAARIVTRIASALDEAHAKGVIHRDLKPGNILFDDRGNAFLSDFGIVKITEANDNSSATGTLVLGTPAYMSPEQALGKPLDRRTDIYALGSVLYEMLTGTPPYSGPTGMSIAMKHVVEAVPTLQTHRPDLPEEADAVLGKAMAKDVAERFDSAGAVANALNALVQAFPQHSSYIPTDAMPARQLPAVPMDTEEVELPNQIPNKLPTQFGTNRRRVLTVVAMGFVVGLIALIATLWLTGQLRVPASTRPTSVPFRPDISFLGEPTFAPDVVEATNVSVPEFKGTTIAAELEITATDTATPTDEPTDEPAPIRATDPSPIAGRPYARLVATGGALVNIRTGPGFDYQLFAITRGTVVTATAFTNNSDGVWYQVKVEGGRAGWVSRGSVTPETRADELAVSELSPILDLPQPVTPTTPSGFPGNTLPSTATPPPTATPRDAETSTPTATYTPLVTPTRTPTPSLTPSPTNDVMTVTPTPIP